VLEIVLAIGLAATFFAVRLASNLSKSFKREDSFSFVSFVAKTRACWPITCYFMVYSNDSLGSKRR
jgi:hypothetical protein